MVIEKLMLAHSNWGVTITTAYLPLDNTEFFNSELNLVEWLGQYGVGNEGYDDRLSRTYALFR
jgi:hypothetical protein